MSWEGYDQILCESGHLSHRDITPFEDPDLYDKWRCGFCGGVVAWTNQVDITNGSHDEDGTRIDGYVELEVVEPESTCVCDKCNMLHIAKHTRYKIPQPTIEDENCTDEIPNCF